MYVLRMGMGMSMSMSMSMCMSKETTYTIRSLRLRLVAGLLHYQLNTASIWVCDLILDIQGMAG